MDLLEREQYRPRYGLCRAGFGLIAFGLGLVCLDTGCWLVAMLALLTSHNEAILNVITGPWWEWVVGAPITWCTLLGSYLLWGRWTEPVWQRRAGLLLVFNFIDLVLWGLHSGEALGLRPGAVGHVWARSQLAAALGWAEFGLIAGLAAEVLYHLGATDVTEPVRRTRAVIVCGAILWGILFLLRTDWGRGLWPLGAHRWNPATLLLWLGSLLLRTIVSAQLTRFCIRACRHCSEILAELRREYEEPELLQSRSESSPDDLWKPSADDPWA